MKPADKQAYLEEYELLKKKGKPFFPYPLKTTVLQNGLTVVRVPFKSPRLVAYYSVVRVGSRNEVEPDHTGFAHFFEHVMFKGEWCDEHTYELRRDDR